MLKKSLIFSGFMAIIAGNAFATGENIVTSKAYVDNELSQKQNTISTGLVEFNNNEDWMLRSIVASNAAGTALNGDTIGILDYETVLEDEGELSLYSYDAGGYGAEMDNFVPTVRAVANELNSLWLDKQNTIPKSGYNATGGLGAYNTNAASDGKSWLNANVAGTGLVTKTATDGRIGERKIFEASDVSGYSALTGNNKLIADISIPTVGAMMSALTSNILALPWTQDEHEATIYYNTSFGDSQGNYYWPAADANKLVNGTAFANALALKQNKIGAENANLIPGQQDVTGMRSVLAPTANAGELTQIGLWDADGRDSTAWDIDDYFSGSTAAQRTLIRESVPTVGAVEVGLETRQARIPAGTAGNVVTYSGTEGEFGSKGILQASEQPEEDAIYHYSRDFTGTGYNWPVADATKIVDGAAFANGLSMKQNVIVRHAANVADSVLTDSTADGVVNKRAIYDGSTTYAAATDANKIATAGFVETRQAKKVCAGWPDGTTTPDATHTDANCWLWTFPDD